MGFLRKSYRNGDNDRRYLAATHFEPTGARMVFPCYDEPAFRTTFSVSITHHSSYNAVSNMPQNGSVVVDLKDPSFVTTSFMTSLNMSTYLLAFVVSDFETRYSGQQQIHAKPNAIDDTEFALDSGVLILQKLSEYTGISYYDYQPKMAQIAVPEWFSGAMENWGLVTYREAGLLFNADVNTYRVKIEVTTTIAHEYTHQWFGNLVATDWSYLWLKEGFATLFGYYGAQLAYTNEQYMDLFQIQSLHPALAQDSKYTTRSMNWYANTPADISRLFDVVAYEKAASVLNMFRAVFGDGNWQRGLNAYLQKHALGVATPEDLYDALQSAAIHTSSMTVKQIMETWTNAAGYPVLNVRRNYQTKTVIISQAWFLSDRKLPTDHVWYIPYNVAEQKHEDFELNSFNWLTKKADTVLVNAEPDQWIIFNRQQFGLYRVNYDTRNWELITHAMIINPESIHPFNRAQLIDDAFNLARADLLDFNVVLRLLTALTYDSDYLPWAAADKVLSYVHGKIRGADQQNQFEHYVNRLIGNIFPTLRIDSVESVETVKEKHFRQMISTWACRIGRSDCLDKVQATFKVAVHDGISVHPDTASVVYSYGVQHATDDEFLWLYRRMFNSFNEAERSLIINALGYSQSKTQLKAFLTSSIGAGVGVEVNYNDMERTQVLQAVYSASRVGVDALIDFLDNWDIADDLIYWLEKRAFTDAIANIAMRTNTEQQFDRLKQLLKTVGSLAQNQVVNAAMATVKANLDWYDSLEAVIVAQFLENYA
ncbi:aminopeptidase N-like [Ochlerotatus camptorhynchus]|uniref:aminopeptidase N-like n=1 Tax=Ochlerotatus camptorhynchus TaxID=644619 RepID=UPI0031D0BBFC